MPSFVLTAKDSEALQTTVFRAGPVGDEEAVAAFTSEQAAERYLQDAEWSDQSVVAELQEVDFMLWLAEAYRDGVRFLAVNPQRNQQIEGRRLTTIEIGPQLELSLVDRAMPAGGRVQLRFNAELRAVLGTDFSKFNHRGVVAELGLGINYRNVKRSGIDLLAAISTSYGSERLQDYFYEVDPEFATDTRPVFDAKGGYLETQVFGGLGFRPRKNIRVFVGMFTGLYEGARNQESPLFETTSSTGFAIGFVWTIKTSRRYIDIVDMGSNQ